MPPYITSIRSSRTCKRATGHSSLPLCAGRLPHVANDHREQEDQRNRRGVQHDVLDGMLCPGPVATTV